MSIWIKANGNWASDSNENHIEMEKNCFALFSLLFAVQGYLLTGGGLHLKYLPKVSFYVHLSYIEVSSKEDN